MKEIEVKARVDDFENIATLLVKLGCNFSEPLIQEDHVFFKKGLRLDEFSKGDFVLRIRNSNGEITLTLKKPLENQLDVFEQEIIINDSNKAEEILNVLGYEKVVEIKKKRIKTRYNDLEICFDDVKGLGKFIEVEKLSEEQDSLKVQEELFKFLEGLGVKKENKVEKGYACLAWEKKNGI